ncbi:hypothetical protein N7492_010272 [Penicillium capsulatum]|uniref:Uncharacterized protein n=1 Tax=Penicillium capsulatum TaxID=69766 RepID=A0A9W9HNZ2_9EURO|nr:hypothetical protein N7492_010272 [Penicillium capsulatum]KAJ6112779.1 hypothetical protein N7512_008103 [Penicillium capsulatum]
MVGPKFESQGATGTRFHAKEELTMIEGSYRLLWKYESKCTPLIATDMLLVRIVVGTVLDLRRLVSILETIPVRGDEPGHEQWNCVKWVKEALSSMERDGTVLGTSVVKWSSVRNAAMWYVEKKKSEHRFDGKGAVNDLRVPTWSLLEKRESII